MTVIKQQHRRTTTHWGPIRSLLAVSPVLLLAPWLAFRTHSALPEPLTDLTNPVTGLPQISETRILGFAKYLSEDIGYRTVGTYEHALGDTWMVEEAEKVKKECERVVNASRGQRKLECEVWRQEGSGNHRFDIMNKRLYKTYVNLTNIIIRISDGTAKGKEHAVLVNSHLDSTVTSPGAADDAISVGIMLDCARVLVNTPKWTPKHAIIFLFNNAEESLQDGSHLFSTQHPIAQTVRAVINLEAAGSTGRELLFQATSEEMIEAYSHVPRPFGTIFANDIFSSGVILSDTDFRQFEQYLNVTGLDMAIVGNSYLYHMRKDLVENIQPGVAQHMAENTLALLQYLSASGSPLPNLTAGYKRPTTVFFSHLGKFFIYSFSTAEKIYSALFSASILLAYKTITSTSSTSQQPVNVLFKDLSKGFGAVVAGVVGSLLVPNLVALVMRDVLGKSMSWFAYEYSAIALYAPPTLLGALLSQYLIGYVPEQTMFASLLLIQSFLACAVQLAGIGSAAMFFLSALPIFVVMVLNPLITGSKKDVSLWTYGLGQPFPLFTGTLLIIPVIEVFVPLTGRIGADAPADNIIATIIAGTGALGCPLVLPFAHRFGRRSLLRGVLFTSVLTAGMVAVFSMKKPFDEMHQKRLFALHIENITSQEQHLHFAAADGAPGFELLVDDITKKFVGPDAVATQIVMNDYNSDWDGLYPFSAFLTPFKIELPKQEGYISPWTTKAENAFTVTAINDKVDLVSGTRSVTLKVDHPGLIWTVIAFDAHVLKWTLDDNPPDEYARHFIKEASFYGIDSHSVDIVTKLPPNATTTDGGRLRINFVGMQEKGVWPAKRGVKNEGGVAMELFERMGGWLDETTGGTVDSVLMGCIAGVTEV